jgi:hypothetical protein
MADYTQSQLDAIREAYAAGVTSVSHEGTRTEYRSLADMERIIAVMETDLNSNTRTRTRVLRIAARKDL